MNTVYSNSRPGNREFGSDSSSIDSGKVKKRRSHRPRGCRGGGSRRARKQRREMQFLAQKERENKNVYYLPPLSLTHTNQEYKMINGNKKTIGSTVITEAPDQYNLPALQTSSSFSSSGSSETSSALDILPSMPPACASGSGNGARYLEMDPLPPVSMSVAPAMNRHVSFAGEQHLYEQSYFHYNAPSQVERVNSYQAPKKDHNRNNNHVQKKSYNIEQNHKDQHYTNDRIKKQQQTLSGGGSFFAISPRSFLLGKKKAPTQFF